MATIVDECRLEMATIVDGRGLETITVQPVHCVRRDSFLTFDQFPFIFSFTLWASFSISSAFLMTSIESVFSLLLSTFCLS